MSMGPDTIIIAPFPEMKLKTALFTDFLHAKKGRKKGPPRLPRIDTGTGLWYNIRKSEGAAGGGESMTEDRRLLALLDSDPQPFE